MIKTIDCFNACIYVGLLNFSLIAIGSSSNVSDRSEELIPNNIQSDLKNCANENCKNFLHSSKGRARRKRNSDNFCTAAPKSSPDKIIKYNNCNKPPYESCVTNGTVPEYTVAEITCNVGYSLLQEDTSKESVCLKKRWIPPISQCYKICDKLYAVNVDLECFRKNTRTSCDEKSLLAGARVRPTCKHLHTYSNFQPTYQDLNCEYDGKWDNALFSCVPECGRPFEDATTLISQGTVERFGDSPWHVAIYNQNKILICGGTIITTRLVLSAAHCFYNDETNTKSKAENYEVVVSKFTRNYSTTDNSFQKVFKIKEIRFSHRDFIGLRNYFAADIALLILEQRISISPTVLPACVHWVNKRQNPFPGALGKVVGWGMNENDTYTEKLMTTNLPYISHSTCLNMVPDDFKPYVTFDKFCAGSQTGPGVLQGDSGGGLMFLENNYQYYIRGLVSLKQRTVTPIASFTNITDHIDWIIAVRKEVEQECGRLPGDSGDFPWHAIIHRTGQYEYRFCGGTIISPRVILSSTDCNLANPNDYEIVLNKIRPDQKIFKIREFRYFDQMNTNGKNDVMIIILRDRIVFNTDVSPACVTWINPKRALASNSEAQLVQGFMNYGLNGGPTEYLLNAKYLDHDACIDEHGSHTPRFAELITQKTNSFCLDLGFEERLKNIWQTGHGVMFQEDSRYFVRGVVGNTMSSAKHRRPGTHFQYSDQIIASVADILQYTDWIKTVRDEIDP